MKNYIVFGFTDESTVNPADEPTQEDRQEIFAKWRIWAEKMGDKLVSMGSPLIHGVRIDGDGVQPGDVSDLAGYMIIKAENHEHAATLLQQSPLFRKGHGQKYELFECVM